jgi:choline-sulfatase
MLPRRHFLLSATASAVAAAPKKTAERPNIVLVLADDLGAWMTGIYGNKEIATPNIDRMAMSGSRFLSAFCCSPVCSPARATLFTGLAPSKHRIQDWLNPKAGEQTDQSGQKEVFDLPQTIFSDLKAAGYRVGYSGKLHLGQDQNPKVGFDWSYTLDGGITGYQDPTMYLNGEQRQEKGYLAELITQRAGEFLDQQKSDQPFFLTVSHQNPHTPYVGHPEKYLERYKDSKFESFGYQRVPASTSTGNRGMFQDLIGNLRKCAAAVTALDDQVGALEVMLQKRGLYNNTLFIFTADNGYMLGQHGLWGKGNASSPLNMHERAMQVPLIMSWPGHIPVQAARGEMVSHYDFVPTIWDAAGITPSRPVVGRSYLPRIRNQKLDKKDVWPIYVYGQYRYVDYIRDQRYKLVARTGKGENELFDLRNDPEERINQFANPEFINTRNRLQSELIAWKTRNS